jgi:hypothetical protein
MNDKAKYLFDCLNYAYPLKQFQRNFQGREETYCNLFARSILNWKAGREWVPDFTQFDFCYDISTMNPGASLEVIERRLLIDVEYANLNNAIIQRNSLQKIIINEAAKYTPDGGTTEATAKQKWMDENPTIVDATAKMNRCPMEVDSYQAYNLSNQGVPVLIISPKTSAPKGHEAIVCPSDEDYDESRGNRIAQAGWVNGMFWMKDIFDLWRSPQSDIKFFVFPKEV